MSERGKFIVIDGLPGAGKTTVTKWMVDHWPTERRLLVTREPGGTRVGEAIRYAVQSPEIDEERHPLTSLMLYSAARAQLVYGVILPALKKGWDVWADRYWSSTWAFQGQNVPSEAILAVSRIATGGLLPDKWLYLCGDPQILLRRKAEQNDGPGSKDDVWDLRPDIVKFTENTNKRYRELGKRYPQRWRQIEADGTFGEKVNKIAVALAEEGIVLRDIPSESYDLS